ncbi:Rv1815 family serine proteinase [Mycolicibacterium arenosum]|uniref:Rv1815 family serine proteinase n=1 Tax=Mycolicibacterium arenosum TaxID=2952157 RepID=UPI0038CD30E8
MLSRCLRILALATVTLLVAGVAPAHANPGTPVFPGMEIRQDTNLCTVGFVDIATRTAYSAGHCHGSGPVKDRAGNLIGHQTLFRDNTPNGTTVSTDHMITDWEAIALLPEVQVNNILPGGRVLVVDPSVIPQVGQRVCHFGVVTQESCGTVEAVNNGWFTMTNGVVSQKGDSGGPVYVPTDDNRAIIVGMFNSTWGQFPAAVSWQATEQQIRQDVFESASGTVDPALGPAG